MIRESSGALESSLLSGGARSLRVMPGSDPTAASGVRNSITLDSNPWSLRRKRRASQLPLSARLSHLTRYAIQVPAPNLLNCEWSIDAAGYDPKPATQLSWESRSGLAQELEGKAFARRLHARRVVTTLTVLGVYRGPWDVDVATGRGPRRTPFPMPPLGYRQVPNHGREPWQKADVSGKPLHAKLHDVK